MKKIVVLLLAGILLAACSSQSTNKSSQTEMQSGTQSYKIGVLQIAEHSALDANRQGFLEALEKNGLAIEVEYLNAQGDVNNALAMAKKLVDNKVNLLFAIGTPAAQAAKQATKETDIPVVFSAVTDPVEAQLVQSWEATNANITGTSDKTPTKLQLEIFRQIKPEVETVGILYNTGETNSAIQLADAEKAAAEIGLTIVPVGITSINDIPKAMEVLLAKTDGMYTLTDNLVASSLELISHTALNKKYLIVQSYIDESDAAEGILISNGFSYYELGAQTADMATSILKGEKKADAIPVGKVEKTENLVRQKALEALEIDRNLPIIKEATIK